MAEKGFGSMSELQHRSEPSSICSTASGTAICKMSRPHRGMCMVTLPTPLRSAARAASTAAPTMPSWPAMRRRCPNVPLCPSEGRFFHFSTNHWREMICALLASMLQKYAFRVGLAVFVASILFLVVSRLRWGARMGEGQAGSGEKCREEETKMWHKEQKQAKFVSKLLSFCRKVLLFREKVVDFLANVWPLLGRVSPLGKRGRAFRGSVGILRR